ncbi:MAG: transcriptional repressor LexA [Bdellovibrionaceae bacterium]|nr:transcriptional repressor LexA [Pseudobdellovibrionaceae bacterium]
MKKPLPPLTEKEKGVLAMIEASLADNGISPSYQEIRDHFGFASFNSVQNYLKQLTNKGYIQIPSHQKRAIVVLHSANAVQESIRTQRAQSAPAPRERNEPRSVEACELPLLGKVAAGLPIEAMTDNEFIDVPLSLVRNPQKTFALQVSGQSMIEDGIFDGDLILVQKQTTASNGEIVVATVDGESTVKRFYFQNSPGRSEKQVELRPANSTMKTMWYAPHLVKIQGVVVGLIRKF